VIAGDDREPPLAGNGWLATSGCCKPKIALENVKRGHFLLRETYREGGKVTKIVGRRLHTAGSAFTA
jgi:hypothetical protein